MTCVYQEQLQIFQPVKWILYSFYSKEWKFISYKSSISSEEIQNAKSAIKILGGAVVEEKTVHLPCSDMDRTFVVVYKTNNTEKKYPRKAGTPFLKNHYK